MDPLPDSSPNNLQHPEKQLKTHEIYNKTHAIKDLSIVSRAITFKGRVKTHLSTFVLIQELNKLQDRVYVAEGNEKKYKDRVTSLRKALE